MPEGAARFPLLLVLADAQIAIGDLSGALETLKEAENLAVGQSDKKALAQRKMRFSDLKALLPPLHLPEEPSDTSLTLLDTLETEEPPGLELLVTNSFFETDLRQVLTDLSMETGIPILWDNTVQGLVTYEAVEQPLEGVLKAILLPAGYTFSFQDGTYFVGSSKPEDPTFALLSVTEVLTLSNIDAVEAINLLSDYFKPYVKASKSTNIVCISAPPATVERIRSDLALLDQLPVQILIEAVVTEISTSALRKMGLDWSISGVRENPAWQISTDHTDIEDASIVGDYMELGVEVGKQMFDLAASLEALVQSGEAKIRANPRIATLNGRTAEISLTKDQYFIIATSVSQYYQYSTLQAVSFGIKLEIIPYASKSGEITVFVKTEVGDVVGKGANNLPEISKRSASTSVRVRNGETFTIGGLNIQQEKKIKKKIPLLGDIPLLGYLFRYEESEIKDTEIVIFITPHILEG